MGASRRDHRLSFLRPAPGLLAVMLLLLLVGQACASSPAVKGGQEQKQPAAGANVGQVAPDFTLADFEGKQVRLSDLRGKVVFLNFWTTWCPGCRAELPEIEAVYQEHKDKGVVVIGVDIMESAEVARQFVDQRDYNWTFVLDATGSVADLYGIFAIPTSLFLDREGIIRAVNIGEMTRRQMKSGLALAMR